LEEGSRRRVRGPAWKALQDQEREERAKIAHTWAAPFAEWSRALARSRKARGNAVPQPSEHGKVDARQEIVRIASLPCDCSPFEILALRPQASEAEIQR
jgi:hypothetical protein